MFSVLSGVGDHPGRKIRIEKTSIEEKETNEGAYAELSGLQDAVAIPHVAIELLLSPIACKSLMKALFANDGV